jgi:hypothetical protein
MGFRGGGQGAVWRRLISQSKIAIAQRAKFPTSPPRQDGYFIRALETDDATKEEPCERCGAPTPFHAGDKPICEVASQGNDLRFAQG